MCNASAFAVKYSEVTRSILLKPARRKSFVHDSASDAYIVQGSADWPNNRGRSYSHQSANARSRTKSRDSCICNYCKKPGYIKVDCRALKARNEKAQRVYHKGGQQEVNYISATEVLTENPNILSIENPVKSEVLLTTEESSTCLLDSGASYHVTPHSSQFQQYSARHSESVQVWIS